MSAPTSADRLTLPERLAIAVVVVTAFLLPVVQFAGPVVWLEAGVLIVAAAYLEWMRWRRAA